MLCNLSSLCRFVGYVSWRNWKMRAWIGFGVDNRYRSDNPRAITISSADWGVYALVILSTRNPTRNSDENSERTLGTTYWRIYAYLQHFLLLQKPGSCFWARSAIFSSMRLGKWAIIGSRYHCSLETEHFLPWWRLYWSSEVSGCDPWGFFCHEWNDSASTLAKAKEIWLCSEPCFDVRRTQGDEVIENSISRSVQPKQTWSGICCVQRSDICWVGNLWGYSWFQKGSRNTLFYLPFWAP